MSTTQTIDNQENLPDAMPLRRDDLTVEELDGEAILYDPRYGAVHRFNAVTLFVWDLCDGLHTIVEISQCLTQVCEVDPDEGLDSVQRVIAELQTLDLLQGTSAEQVHKTKSPWWTKAPPVRAASVVLSHQVGPERARLSRRELLRGSVTKLVFIAPVISTFFATGAYASGVGSADCRPINFSCTVTEDCCDFGAQVKCDTDDKCCIKKNRTGCVADEDCCIGDVCNAGTCE